MTDRKIKRVNFTFALPGGMWIERQDGSRNWESFGDLKKELGGQELQRLRDIAQRGGMTGMWYNAENGQHVFVRGQEVN